MQISPFQNFLCLIIGYRPTPRRTEEFGVPQRSNACLTFSSRGYLRHITWDELLFSYGFYWVSIVIHVVSMHVIFCYQVHNIAMDSFKLPHGVLFVTDYLFLNKNTWCYTSFLFNPKFVLSRAVFLFSKGFL